MEFASTLILSAGLGLLGFVEPCTVGSTAVLFRTAAGLSQDQRLSFAGTYVLVRAVLTGILGIAAVYVGSRFLAFQNMMWIGLGVLYVAIGIAYLAATARV
jgi:cytochrome c-type biogenesis protein